MRPLKFVVLLLGSIIGGIAFSQENASQYLIDLVIQVEPETKCGVAQQDTINLYQDSLLILCTVLDSSGQIELTTRENGKRWVLPDHNYKIEILPNNGFAFQYDKFNTFNITSHTKMIRELKRINICLGSVTQPYFVFDKNNSTLDSVNAKDLEFLTEFFCEFPKGKIAIIGFRGANENIDIDKLRALTIVNHLKKQGISEECFIILSKGLEENYLDSATKNKSISDSFRSQAIKNNRIVMIEIIALKKN
jgi:outer membrane protein OmpA-like peptidoglycan-associated protein